MATREAPGGSPADRLRLARIEIQDYKAIEHLALDFPPPSTPEELDVFVIGSRNGVGKTSVLECCALVFVGNSTPSRLALKRLPHPVMIRAGRPHAVVSGHLTGPVRVLPNGFRRSRTLEPQPSGGVRQARIAIEPEGVVAGSRLEFTPPLRRSDALASLGWAGSLLGASPEPLDHPPVLLLHSYRKVSESNLAVDELLIDDPMQPASLFKRLLVQALMARGGLFEGAGEDDEPAIEVLNGLVRAFAGGTIDKLKATAGGSLDLRVSPVGGGPSFSFDGLSSGQKELISTLFLIWYTTRDRPSIVLIDEPELHLNAEWQRLFVHHLGEVAPRNQYIMATHAEEIFASVPAERRLMLEPE